MPPYASSRIDCQNAHSLNRRPQPQTLFWIRPCCQMVRTSPTDTKPSTCPSTLPSSVLPLRPSPATYNTLILPSDIIQYPSHSPVRRPGSSNFFSSPSAPPTDGPTED